MVTIKQTPVVVLKLLNYLRDFDKVKKRLVEFKVAFCNAFEEEVECIGEVYSEDVFDYIYNVYDNKKVFKTEEVFAFQVNEFKSLDFHSQSEVQLYIAKEYQRILVMGKEHFMRVLSLSHDDPEYVRVAFQRNPAKIRSSLRSLI